MKRKRTLLGLFLLLFTMLFPVHVLAASWTTSGTAVYSNGICTLTESESDVSGGLQYSVPLDTRGGFTLSFDYWMGDYKYKPCKGFDLLFAEEDVSSGTFGTNYYAIEFRPFSGYYIRAMKYKEDHTHESLNDSTGVVYSDSTWHSVVVKYLNGTVTVTQDGATVFSCPNFAVPNLCYFGFSAETDLYAFGYQKHMVKNIRLSSAEAVRVYLNANGGKTDTASLYVLRNSSGSLPTPTRTGYTFAGWYTSSTGGIKINGTNYNFAPGQTLYAHWTAKSYAVKLNANGGSCSKSSIKTVYASAYGSLPTPKRTGYTFAGWYTKKSGGSRVTNKTKVSTASAHTLYAHWKTKSYKVTFNPNKGTLKNSMMTRTVKYSQKIGSLPTPTRKNYTFQGWYTKKTGGKKITSSTLIKKKTTYYAHWVSNSKKVTFKLNANGGSCSKSTLTTTYGGKLTGLPTPKRSGYTFQGWYTAKTGGTRVKASTKAAKILTYKTLYAHWQKKSSGSSLSSLSKEDCPRCGGSGRCSTCGGSGVVYKYMPGIIGRQRLSCTACSGGRCRRCHGSGKR